MRPRAEEGGISLRVEMPSEVPKMTADPEGMRDLLSNLLSNAVRYTPREGSVTFSMSEKGGSLMVEVVDTGIGIEEEALNRVFDEFFRSEAARSFAEEGSGLGLSIVKAVVDQHHGTISVESVVGKGTHVRVGIPLAPGAADRVAGETAENV
jgi:two-component system phosphate regulon sensor histidine kinase PhoR